MGRAFEFRKGRKLKRWGAMAKTFTKIGKQIAMAVKSGGPDPDNNSRLRAIIQNSKAANMPKDNVDRAIKKASSKDDGDLKEMVYEGYGPYGIAFVVECVTDNPTRTVASVRSYFTRAGGTLGTTGSNAFLFEHKCIFRVRKQADIDTDELELELIDVGSDEMGVDEDEIVIYGPFEAFGAIQKFIEEKKWELISADFERIPVDTKQLTEEQEAELEKLISKFEEDDDVVNTFHTMR
jgi:YebC/PmpR family DNA-binding regulatory protein